MLTSNIALKEWAIVVEALERGTQFLLVRKGGIRDPQGSFDLKYREFFLYPTWEHQQQETLRTEFRARFRELAAQVPSQSLSLSVYAGVAFCGEIQDPKALAGLEHYHIWTPEFFEERMRYKPATPTLVVVVRAYRLKNPIPLPIQPEYAGCKSWVPLGEELPVGEAIPVVDNQRFRRALEEISSAVTGARR